MSEHNKKHTIAVYVRFGNASQLETEQDRHMRKLQSAHLVEFSEEHGWRVTGEFFDRCHGRGTERPYLNAMLDHIAQGKAEAVLVMNESRLGRDVYVVEEIERKVKAHGGRIFYADRLQIALGRTALQQNQGSVKPSGTKGAKHSVHSEH